VEALKRKVAEQRQQATRLLEEKDARIAELRTKLKVIH
jgi:hypothetical protein